MKKNEIHEDTKEVNAWLYSVDDDDDDHNEGGEDEVASAGHTPIVLVQCCGRCSKVGDTPDGVGNFTHMNKRQKPIGSEYDCFDPSLIGTPSAKFSGSKEHERDADSSFVMSQAKEENGSLVSCLGSALFRKDKIHQMMNVPEAEGKYPIVVLDKAIESLQTMKLKAKILGSLETWEPKFHQVQIYLFGA